MEVPRTPEQHDGVRIDPACGIVLDRCYIHPIFCVSQALRREKVCQRIVSLGVHVFSIPRLLLQPSSHRLILHPKDNNSLIVLSVTPHVHGQRAM